MSLTARIRRVFTPRRDEKVVTFAGVDHAPVPENAATVCGIWLLLGYTTNPPQGTPCPTCFGDPS